MVEHYPRYVETYKLMMKLWNYGLYCDEHQDLKEEMTRLCALRGKVKSKRGEGKKALLKSNKWGTCRNILVLRMPVFQILYE
jgi:hypothetical protein